MKFGLRGIRALLQSIGDPHKRLKTIHVAGTNGKGSTAAMIAAILTSAGYRTGLYTSPHLVDFRERIRINGSPIRKADVVAIFKEIQPIIEKNRNTFFEAVTAMAFEYFRRKNIDVAVIETGLGGRLDATNVIRPEVSVITTIGIEHAEILGRTLRSIAREKAGIIKRGVPCVTGVQSRAARSVLQAVARARKSKLMTLDSARTTISEASLEGSLADVEVNDLKLPNLKISLAGKFQIRNALLAISAIDTLRKKRRWAVSDQSIRRGLGNIQRYSGLEARLSVVRHAPLILADVAHNPDAVRSLVRSLKELGSRRLDIIFGVMRDKDYWQMLKELKPITRTLFLVQASTERARSIVDLELAAVRLGIRCRTPRLVREAVSRAIRNRRSRVPILITGSHFVVAESLAYMRRRNYLTINQ